MIMETSTCIACGHPVNDLWLARCKDLYLRTPYIVDYGICQECQLVQQVPIPANTTLFYPVSYPMHHSRGKLFSLARRLMIRGIYFVPATTAVGKTLMDFGCGSGSYLQSIHGKVGRRLGFEASAAQARQVSDQLGCEVYSNLAEARDALEGMIDIITAHFVLEHLTDLHAAFSFWNQLLRPDGIVHLAVPNLHSWEAHLFGKHWHGLDAPRHISFPTAKSLTKLSKAHGFRITESRHGIFPNTWAASLTTVLVRRYQHALFLAFMPLGLVLSWLLPQSTSIFQLQKTT